MNEMSPYLQVLGVTQDAGHPQAGCLKPCCASAWVDSINAHQIACLGLVDPLSSERWLLDASPDFPRQLATLNTGRKVMSLTGILLTHGHIGHYTGLMYLGREGMNSQSMPVWAMPRMQQFLQGSGPWEQLIRMRNIAVCSLSAAVPVPLNDRIHISPLIVPHRDEYTETVAFVITGPSRTALYVPDIDRWSSWPQFFELIETVDRAWVDGTFFSARELEGRPMSEVPHPTVESSLEAFSGLAPQQREKIHFIHLNHTNPLLNPASEETRRVQDMGFGVASEGDRFSL